MKTKNTEQVAMSVLGAGSYGTSLAISLARNGQPVALWGHNPVHMATLETDRANEAFLSISKRGDLTTPGK